MTKEEKEAKEQEMLHKAAMIQDMIHQHEGWKYLMEICDQLIAQETAMLQGHDPDKNYVRKLGLLERFSAIRQVPEIVKDKTAMNILLTQGRIQGTKAFARADLVLAQWVKKGQEIIAQHFKESNLEISKKKQQEFHERNLK